MRRFLGAAILGVTLSLAPAAAPARAQGLATDGGALYSGPNSFFGAPGNYGMAWGTQSFGVPRTYTSFTSPGPGYVRAYQPYGLAPTRYGVGLWRPGFVAPGYIYGTASYRTFPVPLRPIPYGGLPPVGAYAPYFGPPSYFAY